jgi:hypothetical protein
MMEQIQALRSALGEVPVALLTPDTTAVFDDILSSLDIIERSSVDRAVVVLVGPTGAGKSYVFNLVAGADSSPEGALRPTTSSIVVAGDPAERIRSRSSRVVVVSQADAGYTLVDTPPWEGDDPELPDITTEADLVVLVVSPIRYADESVAELWKTLDTARTTVVLNRMASTGDEADDLVASVAEMFDTDPFVLVEGGDAGPRVADHFAGLIPRTRSDAVASIMVRAAAAGARLVVRELTVAAVEIGKVRAAVDAIPECGSDTPAYDVQESWDGTRDAIVSRVAIAVLGQDDDVVRSCETGLAERTLASIGPWEDTGLLDGLDAWRDLCTTEFTDASSIRWRRANAEQLIDRFSWSIAINPGIVVPKRFSRIMGSSMEAVSVHMRTVLADLVCDQLEKRLDAWRAKLDEYGAYQPGALATAADALEATRSADG